MFLLAFQAVFEPQVSHRVLLASFPASEWPLALLRALESHPGPVRPAFLEYLQVQRLQVAAVYGLLLESVPKQIVP